MRTSPTYHPNQPFDKLTLWPVATTLMFNLSLLSLSLPVIGRQSGIGVRRRMGVGSNPICGIAVNAKDGTGEEPRLRFSLIMSFHVVHVTSMFAFHSSQCLSKD